MKNISTYLEQLGFSTIEANLYIILLKSGPLTVASLAEKTKINRTAVYSHINSLLEKGVIAKVKSSTNKIIANPPDDLHYLVEQKAIQVGMLKEKLPLVISLLNSSIPRSENSEKQDIKYYKGKAGVKKIYTDCLQSNTIRSYFNAKDLLNIFPGNMKLFNDKLKSSVKVKMYEIIENSPEALKEIPYLEFPDQYFFRILPKDTLLTANDILIYDGKVAIINIRDRNSVDGVVLENRDYYNNSVQLFDLLWRLLPESKI